MNDLQLIKEEIFNCGYIPKLLESMGCDINANTSTNERVEASRPDGENKRSVQVYLNEHLSSRVRSKAHIPIKDVYDLVSYIEFGKETSEELRRNIPKSKKYIIDTLGLSDFGDIQQAMKDDPNAWLKKIQHKRSKRVNLDEIEPNRVLPESILDGFIMKPHKLFLDDNINIKTQIEFEIGIDIQSERVVIPVRTKDSKLIGVRGRATREEDMDYKYFPIYSFKKSQELYGIHKTLLHIQQENKVILWEAEKSVHKSWQMGVKYSLSQMGSDISRIQAEIVKRISPDITIILGFDKGISIEEIKQASKVFGNHDNLYAIVDVDNLLQDKMSPADAEYETFMRLLDSHCYKVIT